MTAIMQTYTRYFFLADHHHGYSWVRINTHFGFKILGIHNAHKAINCSYVKFIIN